MAKSRYIKEENLGLVVADYFSSPIDVSAHNGAFIQLSPADLAAASGAGTLAVQQSNDGVNWVDIGTATITSGKAVYKATDLYCQSIRSKVTLTAGAGTYNILTMIKDQG